MKKLITIWQSLGKFDHAKAVAVVKYNFKTFEGHELTRQERLNLFISVRKEVESMLIKDLVNAEDEVKELNKYFSVQQTEKARDIKVLLSDPNFDQPIKK